MAAYRGKTPGPAHALIDLLNAAASPCKHQPWVGMQGKLSEALEGLLGLEKQQRLAEDITGTKMACTAILTILREAGDWKGLNEHILLLAKRRSQLKQVSPPGPAGSPANSRPWQKTAAPLQPRQTIGSAAPCLCAHKAQAVCCLLWWGLIDGCRLQACAGICDPMAALQQSMAAAVHTLCPCLLARPWAVWGINSPPASPAIAGLAD